MSRHQRKVLVGPRLLLFVLLLASPVTAQAHTTIQGLGEVINGLVHPVMTPSHLLILLGFGLLAGQQSPLNLKTPMLVFIPLSAVGMLLTTTGLITRVYPPVLSCIALCAGTLVALEATPPRILTILLFAAAAVALGLDSGVESDQILAVLKTLFGTWVSLGLLVFDFAYYSSLFAKRSWQKVGIRIMGSWLVAVSLLVLAFALKRSGGL